MENIEENKFESLIELIKDYYKAIRINIDSTSNIVLEDKFNKGAGIGPLYITHGNVGLVSFELSPKNIQRIIEQSEEPLDVVYSSSMGYDRVREIINDYYYKTEGKRIVFIDIRKLKESITTGTPFIALTNDNEEIEIPVDTIKTILINNCHDNGFETLSIKFDEQVLFKFAVRENPYKTKQTLKETEQVLDQFYSQEEEKTEDTINEKEPTEPVDSIEEPKKEEKVTAAVTPIETKKDNNEPLVSLYEDDGTPVALDIPIRDMPITSQSLEDLVDFERVKTIYEINRRNRLIYDATKKKNKYAFLTLICMACTIVTIHTRMNEMNKSLVDTFEDFNTWDTTVDYVEDLGPLPTSLAVLTAYYTLQYVRNMEKVKKIDRDNFDYENALIKTLGNNKKRD